MLAHEIPISQPARRQHDTVTSRPLTGVAIVGVALGAVVFGVNAISGRGAPSTPPAQAQAPVASAPNAEEAAPTAEPQPVVDTEGCQMQVGTVQLGDQGPDVDCAQRALAAAGYYSGPIDGIFSDAVQAAASQFQSDAELYVDGIVGRQTAAQLGIWPGDESFVVRTPPPTPGAEDLEGFELSSVASAGDDAPPLPDDAGQGSGRRIVYSRLHQRVWAIDEDERIVRSYLVSGSQFNNELPGLHEVYSRSEWTTAWNGAADLPMMVRWLDTERGAIGFHEIPRHRSDGTLYQTDDELGQKLSGGCQRQTHLDAVFMWHFGQIGTPVWVL